MNRKRVAAIALVVHAFLFLSMIIGTGCRPPVNSISLPDAVPIPSQGLYVHKASGMEFPITVGEFRRTKLLRYDTGELDVSAGYDLFTPTSQVAATVYVYPAPKITSIGSSQNGIDGVRATIFKGWFQQEKQEILSAHSGIRLAEESDGSV